MEFQTGSKLQVTSCLIASLTYTSRAKTLCCLLPLEFYNTIINAKPVFFYNSISYVEQETDFQLGSRK